MMHYFDSEIALKYGIDAAIVLEKLIEWIRYNRSIGEHKYNGRWWCKQKVKGFVKHLPYYSETQMRLIIRKLLSADLVKKGKFSKNTWDQSNWFSLTDESMLEMGYRSRESKAVTVRQALAKEGAKQKEEAYNDKHFDTFWHFYPRKISKKAAWRNWKTKKRSKVDPEKLITASENYAKLCAKEGRLVRNIMHPSTFLGPDDRWEDYVEPGDGVGLADVAPAEDDENRIPEYKPEKIVITEEEHAQGAEMLEKLTRKMKTKR